MKEGADIEKLRTKLFIDEGKENQRFEEWITEYSAYAKITKDGNVVISAKNLNVKNKVGLVVAIKYLAHKIEPSVKAEVTNETVAACIGIPKGIANARLFDLRKEGFLQNTDGAYVFLGYKLDDFSKILKGEKNGKD